MKSRNHPFFNLYRSPISDPEVAKTILIHQKEAVSNSVIIKSGNSTQAAKSQLINNSKSHIATSFWYSAKATSKGYEDEEIMKIVSFAMN